MGFRHTDLASESLKEDGTTRSDSTVGVEHSIVNCESGQKAASHLVNKPLQLVNRRPSCSILIKCRSRGFGRDFELASRFGLCPHLLSASKIFQPNLQEKREKVQHTWNKEQ